MGMGLLGCLQQIGLGRIRVAVQDVFTDGAVQQRGILRHHPDLAAKRVLGNFRDILAVNADRTGFDIIESHQQVHHCRLTGT